MAEVFLSYSREDRTWAEALARVLEGAGHRTWWDRHVGPGSEFSAEIERALENADAVVVLWSRDATKSPWVRDEAAIGRDTGRLIPASIDGSQPPLGFRQFQAVDLSGWKRSRKDSRISALLNAIERLDGDKSTGREQSVDAAQSQPGRFRPSGLRWAMAAAVVVAIVAAAALVVLRPPKAQAKSAAVVVLPFTDLSPTHDKAYLAEGISEQILSALGTVPKLRIIGRASALALGSNPDPVKLRSRLGVTDVVEGAARTFNNDLRVDVHLIRTSDGSEIWSHEYRGSLSDIFQVQDDIANSVVSRLNLALAPAAAARSAAQQSVGAYELYLAGRALERERTVPKLGEAMAIARQIVAQYPDYARGHALLGELTIMLSDANFAYGKTPVADARPIAIKEAKEAIRLAPDDAAGYGALGIASQGEQAVAALRKAISLDPSRVEFRMWLGLMLSAQGLNDEAAEQYRAATQVEPLWALPLLNWGLMLASSGRETQAIDAINRFRTKGGEEKWALTVTGDVKIHSGDAAGAVSAYRKALAIDPNLRNSGFGLSQALLYFGFPSDPLAAKALASPYLELVTSGTGAMRRRFSANFSTAWNIFDVNTLVRALAAEGDWSDLLRFYDERPSGYRDLCSNPPQFAPSLIVALRSGGRNEEASRLLDCLDKAVRRQASMKYRDGNGFAGSLEELQAAALALRGDKRGIGWLNRAVSLGWIGVDWSPDLHKWPEFNALWADPRMNSVQQRINAIYTRQRAEVQRNTQQH